MHIVLINAPGRFPTVVHDVGHWWGAIDSTRHICHRHSLNYAWWRWLMSEAVLQELPALAPGNARSIARSAEDALDALEQTQTYETADAYLMALQNIDRHVETINQGQTEFCLTLGEGPKVFNVSYDDSISILNFAQGESALAHTIEACLPTLDRPNLIFMTLNAPAELLTGAMAAIRLRRRHPDLHICLMDHGYENFSLSPHLRDPGVVEVLSRAFDTIIERKDDVDHLAQHVIAQLSVGATVRGLLRLPVPGSPTPDLGVKAVPVTPSFSPRPVLHIRLSAQPCYWGRCVFCAQNAKFDGDRAPSASDVRRTLDRLANIRASGIDTVIFTDEALPPSVVRRLSEGILARRLSITWACRCKLERAFDETLFALAASAGCHEILFGVETLSPALLSRMDKHVDGQNPQDVLGLFQAMARVGMGVHVNLINGFPGESLAEAEQTVDLLIGCLATHKNATTLLNRFTVFPGTAIEERPQTYGVDTLMSGGDIPSALGFTLSQQVEFRTGPARTAFARLENALDTGLGWGALLARPGGRSAYTLYVSSGHSAIFKSAALNVMDAERSRPSAQPGPRRRRKAFLTGATGFVGSHILEALLAEGWAVSALVRPGSRLLDGRCETVEADLYDLPNLRRALDGVDAIIHCASPRSFDRAEMLVGEVDATGRLLDAWSSGAFIYTSSQTVYGVPSGILTESSPTGADNWYDLAKLSTELQVGFTAEAVHGLGVSLRLPLILGRNFSSRRTYLGEIWSALKAGIPFVFPDEVSLETFGSVFMGARDLATTTVKTVDLPQSGVFNIAGGFTTWKKLIDLLGEAGGVAPIYEIGSALGTGPRQFRLPQSRTVFDCSKFQALVPTTPKSRLEAIVLEFIEGEMKVMN